MATAPKAPSFPPPPPLPSNRPPHRPGAPAESHYAPPHAPPAPHRLPSEPDLPTDPGSSEEPIIEITSLSIPSPSSRPPGRGPQRRPLLPYPLRPSARRPRPQSSSALSHAPATSPIRRPCSRRGSRSSSDRPLLVEGPAGVGKTDLARALAETLGRPLVRLQCYEGLDEAKALYEWDYAKQMLYTQLLATRSREEIARSRDRSPTPSIAVAQQRGRVLRASASLSRARSLPRSRARRPSVLLIDEVDRADPEFEAFLLEVLAENQVTIPELGTIKADASAARDPHHATRRAT